MRRHTHFTHTRGGFKCRPWLTRSRKHSYRDVLEDSLALVSNRLVFPVPCAQHGEKLTQNRGFRPHSCTRRREVVGSCVAAGLASPSQPHRHPGLPISSSTLPLSVARPCFISLPCARALSLSLLLCSFCLLPLLNANARFGSLGNQNAVQLEGSVPLCLLCTRTDPKRESCSSIFSTDLTTYELGSLRSAHTYSQGSRKEHVCVHLSLWISFEDTADCSKKHLPVRGIWGLPATIRRPTVRLGR